jgi:RimJ/RimL family protein N-acetyltransferase
MTDGDVGLRAVRPEDLARLGDWRNAPDLRVRTREFRPLTDIDQHRWFERISGSDRRDFMFIVEAAGKLVREGATPACETEPVGVVGLCHWEPRDQTAEVSFYLGAEEARGKGVARRALRLLHEYGFKEVGLARIWAEVYGFNTASLQLLKGLGYQREGVLRQHVFRQGRRVDSLLLGILREEWTDSATR